MNEITQILDAISAGDSKASDQLFPAVYDDLRKAAGQLLARQTPGQTLQATALVHEAYLRIVGADAEQNWDHRGHFFMAAARAMRFIIVDNIRRKQSLKRGGDRKRVEFQEAELVISIPNEQLLELDLALKELSKDSPREAELVQLRYFAGLTLEESAAAMGISRATASRYWTYARARLFTGLSGESKYGSEEGTNE